MRLRTALPTSLAALGLALTGGGIAAATGPSQRGAAELAQGGAHGHSMEQSSEMRRMHRRAMRDPEMRRMHRAMVGDPEMRRMHQRMMSMGCRKPGMPMHR